MPQIVEGFTIKRTHVSTLIIIIWCFNQKFYYTKINSEIVLSNPIIVWALHIWNWKLENVKNKDSFHLGLSNIENSGL